MADRPYRPFIGASVQFVRGGKVYPALVTHVYPPQADDERMAVDLVAFGRFGGLMPRTLVDRLTASPGGSWRWPSEAPAPVFA